MLVYVEQRQVLPAPDGTSQPFALNCGGNLPDDALLRAIGIRIEGTPDAATNLVDDAPTRLIDSLAISFATGRGKIELRGTGRDLDIRSKYLLRRRRERTTAASTAAFHASMLIPLGVRPGEGIHRSALRGKDPITIEGRHADATGAYGDDTASLSSARVIPFLAYELGHKPNPDRRMLICSDKLIDVSVAQRVIDDPLNSPEGAQELHSVLYRQSDASAVGDRVDGLVHRLILKAGGVVLHDGTFLELRQLGLDQFGVPNADVVAALPEGLDGTALFLAPLGTRARNLVLTHDGRSSEAPVGTANVVNAAGDSMQVLVSAYVRPGG